VGRYRAWKNVYADLLGSSSGKTYRRKCYYPCTIITDNPDEDFTVEQFYRYSIEFLKRSDAVVLVPGWEKSTGTLKEIKIALELGIPVFENKQLLIEWEMSK